MTNYYLTPETYRKKVKKEQTVIDKLNSGELTIDEAEKKLRDIWDVKRRRG